MKFNASLLYLLQELTFKLIDLISHKEYKDFVLDSLKIAHQSLDQDSKTDPLVWSCIANYFALVCHYSYLSSGEIYLPQTIESVDEETLEAYISSYQQLLADNNQLVQKLLALNLEQILTDSVVDNYFGELLRKIQIK